ncbi:hypothetical protein BDA96_04G309100 [Sorghum bicolor]|uniref:Uncharacterized protein n=2 Tax=Sorghum bicolor TaxID=4558 RepID=A0A921R6D8_SORBI|nr:hypothetical protein BDA96_04G309100 [Sorghum bicolor]KXG31058.1 hypothetical protein SORBI_3004G289600 [Sorghum bicolor]
MCFCARRNPSTCSCAGAAAPPWAHLDAASVCVSSSSCYTCYCLWINMHAIDSTPYGSNIHALQKFKGFMLIQLGHCAAVGAQDMHHLRRDIRFRSPPNKLDQRSFFVTLIYPPL